MIRFIVKNFWLKVTALFLAVILWMYVAGELGKGTEQETVLFDRILPYKLIAKEVPIKVNLIGQPRPGYRVLNDQITIKPSNCMVMGPKNSLKTIQYVTTQEIDLGEMTRSVVREIKIKPPGSGFVMEKDFFVTVVVPVQKIEQEKAQK